ncbi:MAG: hypothetical protein ACRDPW_02355 [Mycobacteriales bacterium]
MLGFGGHFSTNFLAYTGLRWGEMSALRTRDVDLVRRRVDVRRAYSDVGGRLELGTPKSHRSQRSVPIPGFLVGELGARLEGRDATALVFTAGGGTPLRLSNWRRSTYTQRARRRSCPPACGCTIFGTRRRR